MKHIAILSLLISMYLTACSTGTTKTTVQTQPENDTALFNADSAYSYVAAQVAMGPRVPASDAHSRCGKWLADELHRHGADTVILQHATVPSPSGGTMPALNIMARFNAKASKRILLLAHWDTRPWADNDTNEAYHGTPIDGANDGASGVGVLLETARQLGHKAPQAGVDILLTDAEDSGSHDDDLSWALGTQYWVKHMPYQPSELPAYGILLDMVGGQNAVFHREYFSQHMAPAVLDKVWATAAALGYASKFNNQIGGGVNDDHIHINMAGIPCIDIIECHNPSTGSFNPTWHTTNDTMDGIDRTSLNAVGSTVLKVIYNEKP